MNRVPLQVEGVVGVEAHHLRRFNVSVMEIGWFMNKAVQFSCRYEKESVCLLEVDEKREGVMKEFIG